jgi:hypothetical protein
MVAMQLYILFIEDAHAETNNILPTSHELPGFYQKGK